METAKKMEKWNCRGISKLLSGFIDISEREIQKGCCLHDLGIWRRFEQSRWTLLIRTEEMKIEKEADSSPAGKGLSNDLVELCILPRLSAKALMKFKCVSKAWHRIISAPHPGFIYMQLQHASSGLLLEYASSEMRKCLSKDPGNIGTLHFTHPINNGWSRIVASCNGLVCIYNWIPNHWSPMVYIGNPFLKDWKQLPYPFPDFQNYLLLWGLAVEVGETPLKYKLVVSTKSRINGCRECEFRVLSSTSGQWKVVKERLRLESGHSEVSVYVMGCLYWKITTSGGGTVLRFSLEEELCSLQPLPEGFEDGRIGECRGKLCCTMFKEGEIGMWFLDQSHWNKRFSINLHNSIERKPRCKMQLRPIMMPFEGGDHFSFSVQGTIYFYDLLSGEISKQPNDWDQFSVIPYKNTLVPLPRKIEEVGDELKQ